MIFTRQKVRAEQMVAIIPGVILTSMSQNKGKNENGDRYYLTLFWKFQPIKDKAGIEKKTKKKGAKILKRNHYRQTICTVIELEN